MSSRCIRGRQKDKRLLPKRLCTRQFAFPYSFARMNKWRLGTSLNMRPTAAGVGNHHQFLRKFLTQWTTVTTAKMWWSNYSNLGVAIGGILTGNARLFNETQVISIKNCILGDNLIKGEGIKNDETPKPLAWLAVFKWYSSLILLCLGNFSLIYGSHPRTSWKLRFASSVS